MLSEVILCYLNFRIIVAINIKSSIKTKMVLNRFKALSQMGPNNTLHFTIKDVVPSVV